MIGFTEERVVIIEKQESERMVSEKYSANFEGYTY